MTVDVRMSGEPDEIAQLVALLNQFADVAANDRQYPNRGGFGVRVYAEVRLPERQAAQAERTDRAADTTRGLPRPSGTGLRRLH